MKFVLYSKKTGDVIANLEAPSEKHALAQEDETQGVLAVDRVPEGDHIVEKGKVKKGLSKEKAARKAERAKLRAKAELTRLADVFSSEHSGYEAKIEEKRVKSAQEYLANPSKVPRLLKDISAIRNMAVRDLAEEWAAKDVRPSVSIEGAETLREKYMHALNHAKTHDDIERLLDEAKAEFDLIKGQGV